MQQLPSDQAPGDGSSVRRFMARRGAIVIKEIRDMGSAQGVYGDRVLVSAVVIAVVQHGKREMSHGVKLERTDRDRNSTASVFLDYEELAELKEALEFIAGTAQQFGSQERDYTEVTYSTRDHAKLGFYQDKDGNQQAFVELQPHHDMSFLELPELTRFKLLLEKGKLHLESRGAAVVLS